MPWFPFWVDDFLSSPKVRRMDATDIGVYILLLCEQHQSDGSLIRDTPEGLAAMFRTETERVEKVLAQCFLGGTRGGYYNPRLRSINLKQIALSRKRSDAAKSRDYGAPDAIAKQEHSKRPHSQSQSHKETNYSVEFEDLWRVARKGGKRKAFVAYQRATANGTDHHTILVARTSHVSAAGDPKFVKHLDGWIREERWESESTPRVKGPPPLETAEDLGL